MLTEDSVVAVPDGLSVADLDGEAVILSSSTYFGLNEVGARAFELAQRPRPIREIVATMLREYAVDQETLTGDLLHFFGAMQEASLVNADTSQPTGG